MVLMLHPFPLGYPSQRGSFSHGAVSSRGRRVRRDRETCTRMREIEQKVERGVGSNGTTVKKMEEKSMRISGCKRRN